MKEGKTLQKLAVELERQKGAKKDFIVSTGAMHMSAGDGVATLDIGTAETGLVPYGVNDIAHRQIGQFLKIPAPYYDRMRTEYPNLLAENINDWFSRTPDTPRMLRTLDGVARAFLSDRDRRIDNFEIASVVLLIIASIEGASVESCELTDSRMYIKVVDPKTTDEVQKGDIVQAGVIITNSEVGMGSVSVSPLVYRLVCSNGMFAQDNAVRKYHVGRVNTAWDDFSTFRDETIQSDDNAFLMKLEDSVRAAVSQAHFSRIVDKMREATEAKIKAAAELGVRHKLIRPYTPRHSGKVERSHREDQKRFYSRHSFYSLADFEAQFSVRNRRSNSLPMRPPHWRSPVDFAVQYI